MSVPFDTRTIFLIGAMTSLVCAITMTTTRRLHRPSQAGVAWGALGIACIGLSMLGLALRGRIPDLLSYPVANALGSCALVVLYESTRRLCQVRPLPWLAASAVAAIFGFQFWLGSSPEHHQLRLMATSAIQGSCSALMVPLLLRRLRRDPPAPVMAAAALASGFVIAHAIRIASMLVGGVGTSPGGQHIEDSLQATVFALFALAPMAHAMVLMSLVNGRIAAELRTLASTDELTGLSTRRLFFERAREMLAQGARSGAVTGLMMIDVDRFKLINDRYGHQVGDRVLAHIAATLRASLGPHDEAGRYGGEEFCAVLQRATDGDLRRTALAACEAVRSRPFAIEGQPIRLSVSIGIASTDEFTELDPLLVAADRRVYLAKALGRDRVVDRHTPAPVASRRAGDLQVDPVTRPMPGAATPAEPSGAPRCSTSAA
jgi:diguanylate cyclase (GGDEF)-like protein